MRLNRYLLRLGCSLLIIAAFLICLFNMHLFHYNGQEYKEYIAIILVTVVVYFLYKRLFDLILKRQEWIAACWVARNKSWRIMLFNKYLLYYVCPILIAVFIIYLFFFWLNKDAIIPLYEQGHRDYIVIMLAIGVVLLVLALIFGGISYVFKLKWAESITVFLVPCNIVGIVSFNCSYIFVESLNRTHWTPIYFVRTVITYTHEGRNSCFGFKVGNKMEKINSFVVPEIKYNHKTERVVKGKIDVSPRNYKVGDSIKIIYGVGALGILDVMEWERIDTTAIVKDWTRKDKDGNWGVDLRKKKTEYGPAVERSLGEYLKGYMPKLNKDYSGWVDASFTIDADGNVCNVHVSGSRAMHRALTEMGKWIGLHHKGQKEKVEIKFCYCCGNPYYMISERVISTDKGPKLKIRDEFDLSGVHGYAFWSVHEETKL